MCHDDAISIWRLQFCSVTFALWYIYEDVSVTHDKYLELCNEIFKVIASKKLLLTGEVKGKWEVSIAIRSWKFTY